MPVTDYTPTVSDVGAIDIARTVDDVGTETGTFSNPDSHGKGATRPTEDQCETLIQRSVQDVAPFLGTEIPDIFYDDAANLVALRTAMWVELTYYAAEVAQNRSPYPEYKALFEQQLKTLQGQIEGVESGENPEDALGYNGPQFSFPIPDNMMTRPF
jgi:hypothetical protein